MSSSAVWLSIGIGVALGLTYGVASHITYRLAAGRDDRRFLRIVLGGVAIRLFAAVTLVVLVLSVLPVDAGAFVVSFLVVFAVALSREIMWLHRRPNMYAKIEE